MKKGCGVILAVWLVLAGAYGYLAWRKVHEVVPAVMIAVIGGTFASALVGSFAGLFTGDRDRAALRRAGDGAMLRDGRLEAASGPIRPLAAALEGPFSGRACVAYEYDVREPKATQSEFAGVALAPCVIDTARGPVRVLGWAVLKEFSRAENSAIDRVRGAAYLQAATFERLGFTSIISVLSELLTDRDGTIRKDFQIGAGTVRLDGRDVEERIVPSGAVVTLLGRWSEAKGGFAPTGPSSLNRLFPGDLTTVKQQVGGNAVRTFALGLFLFLALHAILVPMYLLAPGPEGTPSSAPESVWDERDCDRQKTLLAAGADANESGRDGLTPLMNAARQSDPPCVEHLIAAGARLETADKDGDTALAQAIVAGRDDNVAILRAAGAKDFRVGEETGEPIEEGSAPLTVVKDYIAAVHRGDFETMARLMAGASVERMEAQRADLPLWQSLRPKTQELVRGWMTDNAATLTVRGATPSGERRVTYHLEKSPPGWRITKEWFPDLR